MIRINNKGLLIPRLTTAQMNAIASPADGLIIYNTDCKSFNYFNGNTWIAIGNTGSVTAPGAITGSATPCQNTTGEPYSIAPVTGATGYNWTVPTGASVATGQGTTSVTVDYATTNGNVCVTASNACGTSNASCTAITLQSAPAAAPTAGVHTPSQTQIIWNWNAVAGATGYKWNTVNNYATATDNGASVSYTQTALTCNTAYTLYVWAYNTCGYYATPVTLTQTTSACCPCIVAGFPLRRPIPITNATGSPLTNYQVLISVTYDADMKSDFADLRFRDGSCTDLPYWVETYTASTSATVWVKVPSIPTTGTTIYIYYGNPGATSASNGRNTFVFFDDFSGTEQLTEVDPGTYITIDRITDQRLNFNNLNKSVTAYAAMLVTVPDDFSTDFTWNTISHVSPAFVYPVGFGDSPSDLRSAGQANGLGPAVHGANPIRIEHTTGGAESTSSEIAVNALGVTNYGTFRRLGNTVSLFVYSDAARTTLLGGFPLTYNDVSIASYNRVFAFSSFNDGCIGGCGSSDSGWVDDIRVRQYTSPEPSPSVGAEESCN